MTKSQVIEILKGLMMDYVSNLADLQKDGYKHDPFISIAYDCGATDMRVLTAREQNAKIQAVIDSLTDGGKHER